MSQSTPTEDQILSALLIDLPLSRKLLGKLKRKAPIKLRGVGHARPIPIPGKKLTVKDLVKWCIKKEGKLQSGWNIFEEEDIAELRGALKKHGADLDALYCAHEKAIDEALQRAEEEDEEENT